ncbi:MAG: hypothetical protein ACRC5M_00465 [Anaeroplasmataceae bacterium]
MRKMGVSIRLCGSKDDLYKYEKELRNNKRVNITNIDDDTAILNISLNNDSSDKDLLKYLGNIEFENIIAYNGIKRYGNTFSKLVFSINEIKIKPKDFIKNMYFIYEKYNSVINNFTSIHNNSYIREEIGYGHGAINTKNLARLQNASIKEIKDHIYNVKHNNCDLIKIDGRTVILDMGRETLAFDSLFLIIETYLRIIDLCNTITDDELSQLYDYSSFVTRLGNIPPRIYGRVNFSMDRQLLPDYSKMKINSKVPYYFTDTDYDYMKERHLAFKDTKSIPDEVERYDSY